MSDTDRDSPLLDHRAACPPAAVDGSGRIEISLLPNLDFPPDSELAAQGWERRFMADPARVREATKLYADLGFEVRAEPIEPAELSVVCGDCRLMTCRAYVTIYTRKRLP